jgi:hypothetical protein
MPQQIPRSIEAHAHHLRQNPRRLQKEATKPTRTKIVVAELDPETQSERIVLKARKLVIFEVGRAALVKRPTSTIREPKEIMKAVQAFAQDMRKIKRYVSAAERYLNASLSRDVA